MVAQCNLVLAHCWEENSGVGGLVSPGEGRTLPCGAYRWYWGYVHTCSRCVHNGKQGKGNHLKGCRSTPDKCIVSLAMMRISMRCCMLEADPCIDRLSPVVYRHDVLWHGWKRPNSIGSCLWLTILVLRWQRLFGGTGDHTRPTGHLGNLSILGWSNFDSLASLIFGVVLTKISLPGRCQSIVAIVWCLWLPGTCFSSCLVARLSVDWVELRFVGRSSAMSMNRPSCIRLTSLGGTGGSPAPMYIGGSFGWPSSSIIRWTPSPSCMICCKRLPLGTSLKAKREGGVV